MFKPGKERIEGKKRITAVSIWKGRKLVMFNCAHCKKKVSLRVTFAEFMRSRCPHCHKMLMKVQD